jgi:hypothetical protein
VTRNIDLSVGSMLGFIGMVMGVVQADLLPKLLGFEHPATWILTLAGGLVLGVILGAFQGFVIAYLGWPVSAAAPPRPCPIVERSSASRVRSKCCFPIAGKKGKEAAAKPAAKPDRAAEEGRVGV